MIKILHRKQIDTERWNWVIASSTVETIYPYTWYMDACADHWLAFVMNDYECVMPVAYRSKLGLKYAYQPVYCQQLGVYSAKNIDHEIIRMFLHSLKKHFKMGDYSFNEGNLLGEEEGYEVTDNYNYIVSLNTSYGEIRHNFTENCRRNVKKSQSNSMVLSEDITIDEIVRLKRMSESVKRTDDHYDYIKKLFSGLKAQGKIKIYGLKDGSHLMAAAVFALSYRRAIFLLSASSEMGKEQRAMFRVVDAFIEKHAGQDLKLDFEGSNIPTIARFFRGFGAKPEIYQRISFENVANKIIKKLKRV